MEIEDLTQQCLLQVSQNNSARNARLMQQPIQTLQQYHASDSREINHLLTGNEAKICGLCGKLVPYSNWKRHWDRKTHQKWLLKHEGEEKFEAISIARPELAKLYWFENLPPEYQRKLLPFSPGLKSLPSTYDSDFQTLNNLPRPKQLLFNQESTSQGIIRQCSQVNQETQSQAYMFGSVCREFNEEQVKQNASPIIQQNIYDQQERKITQNEIFQQNEVLIPLLQEFLQKIKQNEVQLSKRVQREDIEEEESSYKRVKISEYNELRIKAQAYEDSIQMKNKEKEELDTKLQEKDRKIQELLQQQEVTKKSRVENIDKKNTGPLIPKQYLSNFKNLKPQKIADSLKDYEGKFFGRTLHYESIHALENGFVLNDEIIDNFLWFFFETIAKNPFKTYTHVVECTVGTLWATKLKGAESSDDFKKCKNEIKEIIKDKDSNFIVMPFNVPLSKNSAHWILVILANIGSDSQKYWKQAQVNGQEYKKPCLIVLDSFVDLSSFKIVAPFFKTLFKVLGINENQYKTFFPNVPQQNNKVDCGAYIIEYEERFFQRPHLFLSKNILQPSKFEIQKEIFDGKLMKDKRKELIFILMQLFNLNSKSKKYLNCQDWMIKRIVECYLERRKMIHCDNKVMQQLYT